ncbi:MAG: hypothetical protein ACRD0S_07055, partial [Acidimicrobiales bacterium]
MLAVLSAPGWQARPGIGLDASWEAAMHMAARQGLRFGSELDFTYGPLGFLAVPRLYYQSTGLAAGLFTFVVQLALCVAVVLRARKAAGLLLALPLAYLAVRALRSVDPPQALPLLALIVALAVLEGGNERRLAWFAPAAGALGAGVLLVKFNAGVFVLAAGAVAAWFTGRRGWRPVAVFAGSAVLTLVALWLLSGNRVGDLATWTTASMEIARGYSTAMGLETGRASDFPLLVLALGGVAWVVWTATSGWERPRRLAAGLLVGLFLFTAFKHG